MFGIAAPMAATSSVPPPPLSPGRASLLAFPSTGRLPSTLSAADLWSVLFEVYRYYTAVRLLTPSPTASSSRLPVVAQDRRGDCGRREVSQVPTRSIHP